VAGAGSHGNWRFPSRSVRRIFVRHPGYLSIQDPPLAWPQQHPYTRLGQASRSAVAFATRWLDCLCPQRAIHERGPRFLWSTRRKRGAPTNTLLGNPAACEARVQNRGPAAAARCTKEPLDDVAHNVVCRRPCPQAPPGRPRLRDHARACGDVDPAQLSSNTPTPTGAGAPVLIIPPPIGRPTIPLDLGPWRSMVVKSTVSRGNCQPSC